MLIWLCLLLLATELPVCVYVLQVLGEVKEFDSAIRKVMSDVRFDSDVIVSVFETNIRVLGYVRNTDGISS